MSGPHEDLFLRIAAALRPSGWQLIPSHRGVEFIKKEAVKGGEFELALIFDPKRPHIPPGATARITKGKPQDFPWHRLDGDTFCHLDSSSIEWDPEGPLFANHVLFIAQRAVDELHRLQRGESLTEADLEFVVHWHAPYAYMDIPQAQWPPKEGARLESSRFTPPESGRELLIYRLAETPKADRYLPFPDKVSTLLVPCAYVDLADHPTPNWGKSGDAPNNLGELNHFLHRHHPRDGKRLWKNLANALTKNAITEPRALIVMGTKAGRFGALVTVPGKILQGYLRQNLPDRLSQDNQLTRAASVERVTFFPIDEASVLGRNQPHQKIALAGKNVHLIGVGAVGSLLAGQLVRAGAGSSAGSLHLYDYDALRPENLGRHLLGAPYLGANKAVGVAAFLKRNLLATNIHALSRSWHDLGDFAGADLVIDATAVPYVGAALSNAVRANRAFSMASVFVEGSGWVAGAFLYRGAPGEACRSCAEPWVGGTGCSVPKSLATHVHSDGCGGTYVPFRVAAADIAASLASELICDWATGLKGKTFRTIRLPGAPSQVRDSRNESPASKPGCACAF